MLITLFSLGLDILCGFAFSHLFVCPHNMAMNNREMELLGKGQGMQCTRIICGRLVDRGTKAICPSGLCRKEDQRLVIRWTTELKGEYLTDVLSRS
jgi:hypothetical protein